MDTSSRDSNKIININEYIQNCIKSINVDSNIDVDDVVDSIVTKIMNEDILHQTVKNMLTEYKNNIYTERNLFKAIQESNIEFKEGIDYFYIDTYLHISRKLLNEIYPMLNHQIRYTDSSKNTTIRDTNKQAYTSDGKKIRCLVFDTFKLPNSIIQKMPMTTNRMWGGKRGR